MMAIDVANGDNIEHDKEIMKHISLGNVKHFKLPSW